MRKQILVMSALFVGMTVFGQKSELKTAEKAIKANDFTAALSAINSAESLIANADQKTKAKFYYLKGKALYKNGSGQIDYDKVGAAFNELIDYEKQTKSQKYSNEIAELINSLITNVATKASDDYEYAVETKEPADYIKAAKGFQQVYALSPKDTSFLDNAALVYYFGKDFETSKKLYEELLDLNYTGISTVYIATNKATGKEVTYNDKKSMDLQVKLGLAENPKVEQKDSRRESIFKNLALNYSELGDTDKALEIIAKGREEFPESYSLLIDEANLYYKMDNKDMFKEKLEEAININPTDPTLFYNVGVMNMEQKNTDEAIKYFEKAIELKPDYGDAYNNIGAAIIDKAEPIIEEMNNSLSDFAKYDRLQAQQLEIYKEAVPFYEKAYEFNGSNISVIQTLMGLYQNLDMTDKYNEIKAVYDSIKE
ncbi:tetratricopeptide repeat protein [Lutibacter sp. B1]|uniref:tetratricopeptide repeat protein n=1 Tax=Lutibacter sp. B1 TaxID=2725996 RepID=UPI00145759E4|nr:tetratricopeptide repeat protein [Lutibacter sp. B1]NLP58189.1 tetratricopeptide repeat protein [Lutibacter sp. B1]